MATKAAKSKFKPRKGAAKKAAKSNKKPADRKTSAKGKSTGGGQEGG